MRRRRNASRWLRGHPGNRDDSRRRAALAIVVTLALTLWPSAPWRRTPPALPAHPIVAVLPFENLSHDANQDYFALGLTDEVIATLARLDGLNVIAATSVMRFRDSRASVS